MAITMGQIITARIIVRSAIKQALEIENTLDSVIEDQKGDLGVLGNHLDTLAAMASAAKGSLADKEPAPTPPPPAEVPPTP